MPTNSADWMMRATSLARLNAACAVGPTASTCAGASSTCVKLTLHSKLPSTACSVLSCTPAWSADTQTNAGCASHWQLTIQPSAPKPGRTKRFCPSKTHWPLIKLARVRSLDASSSPAFSCQATPATQWPVESCVSNSSRAGLAGSAHSKASGCTPASTNGSGNK